MTPRRLLAAAAATGRVGYVFFVDGQLYDHDLSKKAFQNTNLAAAVFQKWIGKFDPDVVIIEKLTEASSKGERSKEIVKTLSLIASHNHLYDIAITANRQGRTRYEQAVHLAHIYPDIAPRLPKKHKFYDSEDRAMVLFDALTLAHLVLESPAIKLASGMDRS